MPYFHHQRQCPLVVQGRCLFLFEKMLATASEMTNFRSLGVAMCFASDERGTTINLTSGYVVFKRSRVCARGLAHVVFLCRSWSNNLKVVRIDMATPPHTGFQCDDHPAPFHSGVGASCWRQAEQAHALLRLGVGTMVVGKVKFAGPAN